MAEESGRPGTSRSKVGCEAMDEPCTNRIVPRVSAGLPAHLFHRNSFTSPLWAQCSRPARRGVAAKAEISLMDRSFVADREIPVARIERSAQAREGMAQGNRSKLTSARGAKEYDSWVASMIRSLHVQSAAVALNSRSLFGVVGPSPELACALSAAGDSVACALRHLVGYGGFRGNQLMGRATA